jgi:phage tail-like protein
MAGDANATVNGASSFKLGLGGIENAMLFSSVQMPTVTIDVQSYFTAAQNGQPVQSCGAGAKIHYGDIVLTRGVDDNHDLWQWVQDIKDHGVCDDTKKDITITAVNQNSEDLLTWNITGAVISSYSMAGVDSNGGGILTEMVTITFQDATLEA